MPRSADRAFAVLLMGCLAVVTDSESRAVGLRGALGIAATIVPADALARDAGFGALESRSATFSSWIASATPAMQLPSPITTGPKYGGAISGSTWVSSSNTSAAMSDSIHRLFHLSSIGAFTSWRDWRCTNGQRQRHQGHGYPVRDRDLVADGDGGFPRRPSRANIGPMIAPTNQ